MLIVTGGVGFIGSNLVYGLNKINQNNIIICDTANSKLKENYLKKAKYKKIVSPSNFFYFLEKNKKKIKIKKSVYILQYIVQYVYIIYNIY